jgi:predicted ATPase
MIHRAKFQNFKALRDVEVTFDSRLTVLVGPNGSGKTSVLQGIHFLTQLAQASDNELRPHIARLSDFFSITTSLDQFTLEIASRKVNDPGEQQVAATIDRDNQFQIRLSVSRNGDPDVFVWAIGYYGNRQLNWTGYHTRPGTFAPEQFASAAFIRFSAARLATPTLVRSYPPRVATDGSGLAATLNHIKNKYPDRFRRIEEAFLRVIQTAKEIKFDQSPVPDTDGIYGPSLLIDFRGAEGVKAADISSGTLFALGLLTVTLGPDSPSVILLDDLDHGLHPKAQMELIDVFRGLVQENPDLQIIATSHSPYILDRLEWNEVRVTSLLDDGSAVCAPLTDHPLYARWKEAMSPGEFWSHGGEDWVKNAKRERVAQ